MKRSLLPYYISRAIVSALLGVIINFGGRPWWVGLLLGTLVFAGFIWNAHSGFYVIDTTRPLMPLRRDARGTAIRDRATVWGVAAGGAMFIALSLAGPLFQITIKAGSLAALSGGIVYFVVTNWLFIRGT